MSYQRENQPRIGDYLTSLGLQLKGPRNSIWKTTSCEFHGGSDSMRVNTASNGWRCMACGASGGDAVAYEMAHSGIDFVSAAKLLGAWVDDGKPPPKRPTPLSARDAMAIVAFESYIIYVAGCNIARGVVLSQDELLRVGVATERINRLREVFQ